MMKHGKNKYGNTHRKPQNKQKRKKNQSVEPLITIDVQLANCKSVLLIAESLTPLAFRAAETIQKTGPSVHIAFERSPGLESQIKYGSYNICLCFETASGRVAIDEEYENLRVEAQKTKVA